MDLGAATGALSSPRSLSQDSLQEPFADSLTHDSQLSAGTATEPRLCRALTRALLTAEAMLQRTQANELCSKRIGGKVALVRAVLRRPKAEQKGAVGVFGSFTSEGGLWVRQAIAKYIS